MARTYHTDIGYITIPEANKVVLRMLRIIGEEDKTHYNKILAGAKHGKFGGKKYGKRMYQVRRDEIVTYAEGLLQTEQQKLFAISTPADMSALEDGLAYSPLTENIFKKCYTYLIFLNLHNILTDEEVEKYKEKMTIRLKMNQILVKTADR